MHWHSSALFLECLRTVFPHTLSCKALYQRWSSDILTVTINSIEGHMPQLWILQVEMAELYVLCFCHVGKLLKISNDQRKQFIYLWEKGGAKPAPCLHSLEGKNQPSLNSLFWFFIQCCDQNASLESLVNNCNACGSQINPQSHTGFRCGISYESRNNFLFSPKIIHNKGLERMIIPGLQRESKEVQIMRETQSDSGTNLFLFLPSLLNTTPSSSCTETLFA